MKKLYVIGNGFDISHRLNTRYSDFYEYLKENEKDFLYNMINAYGADGEEWWNSFEESLGEGDWFEEEFENMAYSVIENMKTDDGEEMPDIDYTLKLHWKSYYEFMDKLDYYVLKWLREKVNLDDVPKCFEALLNSNDYFLNFNFTMVLEEVYKINRGNILHIHGSMKDKHVKMGHGNQERMEYYREKSDKAYNTLDKNSQTVYDAIKSFYASTYKNTEYFISKNSRFWDELANIERIEIYGHSFGDVDIPYFKKIKSKAPDNVEWYYYIYSGDKDVIINKLKTINVNEKYIHIVPSEDFCKRN